MVGIGVHQSPAHLGPSVIQTVFVQAECDVWAFAGEDAPWTNFNDSQLTLLIPNAIMWLVAEAEQELRNDTWLDLNLALDMSRLQSVAYCHPPNVAAWNCTR